MQWVSGGLRRDLVPLRGTMPPRSEAMFFQIFRGCVSDNRYRLVCRSKLGGGDDRVLASSHCLRPLFLIVLPHENEIVIVR
jgi:hypothetical protein